MGPSAEGHIMPRADAAANSPARRQTQEAAHTCDIRGGQRQRRPLHRRKYHPGILTIHSHNIRGFGLSNLGQPQLKIKQLLQNWRSSGADVILLQETHTDSSLVEFLNSNLPAYACYWSHCTSRSGGAKATAGVAILIRKQALVQHGGYLRVVDNSLSLSTDGRQA